jgi:hypothetical protein
MALFQRKAPEPEAPKGGGLEILRARARSMARTVQGHIWVREALSLSGDRLDLFLAGGDLALPKIDLLINYLGACCEYLPDVDLLRSTAPPPEPAGFAWSPFDLTVETYPPRWRPGPPPLYPRSPDAERTPPRPAPGWAS